MYSPGVKFPCESLMELAVEVVPEFPPQIRSLGAIVDDAPFKLDRVPVFRIGDIFLRQLLVLIVHEFFPSVLFSV